MRARTVSIRVSLLGNLLLVIALLSGTILMTTYIGARQTVRTLSGALISQTIQQTEARLAQFFQPVVQEILVARSWGQEGLLNNDDPAELTRLFTPIMKRHSQISSLLVADERGHEYMLLHIGHEWKNRQTKRDEWDSRTRWLEWTDQNPKPVESWKVLEYDPRQRPWYQGAIRQYKEMQTSGSTQRAESLVHWTKPYTFYTTKDPGITASVTYRSNDGLLHVLGFDMLLSDISQFTTGLQVSENGKVAVLTEDERVVGLPHDARYDTPAKQKAALLKKPSELGVALATDAARAFASRPADKKNGPLRFKSNGEPWWGESRPFKLGIGATLSIVVLVPEADLLGGLTHVRRWLLFITVGMIILAVIQAFYLARRYGKPIEALVQQSDRISRGDLASGEPLACTVTEVRRLAEAHNRMRIGLQSLLKLEDDLQLAREIQQRTFPDRLPELKGFEIKAWSEPAEQTGGDTYDIIGYRSTTLALPSRLSTESADAAMLLMADATGHGIGPALSATQIRAMLRMAVRTGETLFDIARHINEQLCSDLHGGRFITAWLGELDSLNASLTYFSAGQAPLIYYSASNERFTTLEANTPPFGILRELKISIPDPVQMLPGDIFAVLSDGIFDARNDKREQFGIDRVTGILASQLTASPAMILDTLREALTKFTVGVAPSDDRTAIIIKRTK